MQVINNFSIIDTMLVKDRIPYDLIQEIMIMQMRVKQECSANEERRKISRNCISPGNNRKVETKRLGECSLRS